VDHVSEAGLDPCLHVKETYIERNEQEKPDDGIKVSLRCHQSHANPMPVEPLIIDVDGGGTS